MKIVERIDVVSLGGVASQKKGKTAAKEVETAILATDWPHGSGSFKLNPGVEKNANGVLPMKLPCISKLKEFGWEAERLPKELAGVPMGNLDAIKQTRGVTIGFEWETGNISSSHRAINKIFHAMLKGGIIGGFLVLPSENMRRFLTDRIGNITELREYFPVWQAIAFPQGVFRILVVEHDELDQTAPLIPKQKDGNAKK